MRNIASKLTEEQLSDKELRKVDELDELTPKYYMVKRLLNLKTREILDLFVEPLIAGSVMLLDVYCLRWLLSDWSPLPLLLVSTLVGALAYLGVLWLIAKPTLLAAWYAISSFVRSSRADRKRKAQTA